MFVKSLSMKGFKSFADPTVLSFESGITVVVGPNGSGKSNVVDAVTWVLGAQGPRSMRLAKMEDVIFMGTASRPALGRAEVSLTIDNSSGKLPVEMAEVTISRTLFRSGESEYAINGTPCRLIDIQDLLSDSGVGRSQHMIVGQNQLVTIITARPEERRVVIEEAAGVLKHRRRRERAERRLAVTGENLERLGDLVRELRRQIRPLERQAAAARQSSGLIAELRAVRLHVAGTEMAELALRGEQAQFQLGTLGEEEERLDKAVAALDAQATHTASQLTNSREQDLASALGQVQALIERARGMGNVLKERTRTLSAALDAAADVNVVSTLVAEAARVRQELLAVDDELVALEPADARVRAARSRVSELETAFESLFGAQSPENVDHAGALRARIEVTERSLLQDRKNLTLLDERLASLRERASDAHDALETAERARALSDSELIRLTATLASSNDALQAARRDAEVVEGLARDADQERHRSAARAEALGRALLELEGAGGKELLAGVDGVVGSLVDLVEIDPGWEDAFQAAAGASVAAVVVRSKEAAHEALARLHRQGATGALLAAQQGRGAVQAGPLPSGAELVRTHVRARRDRSSDNEIEAVLDVLLGRAVRVRDWEAAFDLALDRPELVVVTGAGDRFADSGWRVRSAKGVVTAAAVEEAEQKSAAAAQAADLLAARLATARRRSDDAQSQFLDASTASERAEGVARAATDALTRARNDIRRIDEEIEQLAHQRTETAARLDAESDAFDRLQAELPEVERAAIEAAERASAAAAAAGEIEEAERAAAEIAHAFEVKVASMNERRSVLIERQAEVERRLAAHADERDEAAARRARLEADGVALAHLGEVVDAQKIRLEAVLDDLRNDYRLQVETVRAGAAKLEEIRRERTNLERRQAQVRESRRALDIEASEARVRKETLERALESDLQTTPEEAAQAPLPEIPEGLSASAYAASLAERLHALGPVNPLALDELAELEERHKELDTQMQDVRSARRELQEVIRTLDREIMATFASAAADVNENFSTLIAMLFPGGTGRLILTDPNDLLSTGVDVEIRPPGRNVRRINLLSGGEQSMVALAFLFAVFRSRPSPFYLMDEVEAALDDVNLHRFLGLVREFRDEAQLIIVSHQKRTMECADALYGVTMAPGGSSQVVSQKVRHIADSQQGAPA